MPWPLALGGMGQDRMGWDRVGWDRMDGMGQGGMGWDGMEQQQIISGAECGPSITGVSPPRALKGTMETQAGTRSCLRATIPWEPGNFPHPLSPAVGPKALLAPPWTAIACVPWPRGKKGVRNQPPRYP